MNIHLVWHCPEGIYSLTYLNISGARPTTGRAWLGLKMLSQDLILLSLNYNLIHFMVAYGFLLFCFFFFLLTSYSIMVQTNCNVFRSLSIPVANSFWKKWESLSLEDQQKTHYASLALFRPHTHPWTSHYVVQMSISKYEPAGPCLCLFPWSYETWEGDNIPIQKHKLKWVKSHFKYTSSGCT